MCMNILHSSDYKGVTSYKGARVTSRFRVVGPGMVSRIRENTPGVFTRIRENRPGVF